MASRSAEMQTIFSELSEENKDIMILIARSMKIAQVAGQKHRNSLKNSKGD